jgi:predicted DNA-binding transcriptional regulator YafY
VERLALLRRAVWDDRCLDVVYEDRQLARTTRVVDPYGLVSKAGVWYLVARTLDGYRSFRVERMRDVCERNERFERDPAFDLDAHWRQSASQFRDVRPRFAVVLRANPDAIEMIASFWPTESIERDGERALCVQFSSEATAVSYLMTWGMQVELIEPLSLCEPILARARALCERYEPLASR